MSGASDVVAAAEAETGFPVAYAERARAAARRLDPLPPGPMAIPQALDLVAHQARIDVDVPLRSQRPSAKAAKVAVKRVTAWYLRYLADQVGDLGQALVHLGTSLAARVDEVAAGTATQQAQLDDLTRRVAALEATAPAKTEAKPQPKPRAPRTP